MTAPKRRGRPTKATQPTRTPRAPVAALAAPIAASTLPAAPEGAPEEPQRRRRASVGGHALKLSAPTRPGWTRRFFNDDANRLAEAHELGYTPVSDTGIKSSGPGSVVTRRVGTKANGEPLQAILMETPDELYAEGVAEKIAHSRKVDEAIAAGRDSTGQMQPEGSETYGHGSIKSDALVR